MKCLCGKIADLQYRKRVIEYMEKLMILEYEVYVCPSCGLEFGDIETAGKIQRKLIAMGFDKENPAPPSKEWRVIDGGKEKKNVD